MDKVIWFARASDRSAFHFMNMFLKEDVYEPLQVSVESPSTRAGNPPRAVDGCCPQSCGCPALSGEELQHFLTSIRVSQGSKKFNTPLASAKCCSSFAQ